jgi:hypothetical protein
VASARKEFIASFKVAFAGEAIARELTEMANKAWLESHERELLVTGYTEAERKRRRF